MCTYSNRPYFTVDGFKLPANLVCPTHQSKPSEGFTLLECVIAMFILAILTSVVLKHQAYLLEKQAQIEESAVIKRTTR